MKVFIINIFFALSLFQDNNFIEITWKHKEFKFLSPNHEYTIDTLTYLEGVFFEIQFLDSTLITLHHGTATEIPLIDGKSYKVLDKKISDGKVIRCGKIKETGKYWGEINGDKYNIYFLNVPEEKVPIYKKVIESVQINY
jgi:hypothetical protein